MAGEIGREAPRRVAGLDGLRGLGILCVLMLHMRLFRGPSGLCLLFVLSGFLITGILLRKAAGPAGLSLRWFAGRRTRRLVPGLLVYLSALGLLAAAGCVGSLVEPDDLLYGAAFSTDLQMFGWSGDKASPLFRHLWSLGVEVKCYIALPLLIALFGRYRAGRIALSVLLLALTAWLWWVRAASGLGLFAPGLSNVYLTLARVDAIAMGCCAALLLEFWRPSPAKAEALGAAALLALLIYPFFHAPSMRHLATHYASSILGGTVLVAALGAHPVSRVGWLLDNIFLRHVGTWSFGAYLWHPLAILSVKSLRLDEPWLAKALMLILSLAAGALSWHVVEKRFMGKGAASA